MDNEASKAVKQHITNLGINYQLTLLPRTDEMQQKEPSKPTRTIFWLGSAHVTNASHSTSGANSSLNATSH